MKVIFGLKWRFKMREIKFRAWHKTDKIFCDGTKSNMFGWMDEGQDIELMQYTGLNDKNGASIYEGDIVEYEYDKNNYRVEFINGSFKLRRFYKNIINLSFIDCDYGKEIQVIGNIYENYEILMDKK